MSGFLDLSKFLKKEEIGHGAFGHVYKAVEISTNKILAAKISSTELNQNDTTLITDLKHEVNILSQLNHPSVLNFIGYSPLNFDQEPYPVIITDYFPNGSLDDLIKSDRKFSAPESWTDTKKLINIYGIASAMKYLHLHNILHRDLKPANILETENLFPKIADFGLSKSYKKSDNNKSKLSSGVDGTPIYIAPEIWRDHDYTKAGDVYAFSIIMYEILTLDEPFKDLNIFSLMVNVGLKGERPEFKYPLPECYKDLIERCWSSNPNDRPTFEEIVIELRTNKEFIIETIDENEFFEYVDSIDILDSSFNRDKKLKTLILKDKNLEENVGSETNEQIEEEEEEAITVETFNNLPLKYQQLIISNIIENKDKESLLSLNELLIYLNSKNLKEDEKYILLTTKNEYISIEEFIKGKIKISISQLALENINKFEKSEIFEFYNCIENIDRVSIELHYPCTSFDSIYNELITYKEQHEGVYDKDDDDDDDNHKDNLRINIFISGIDKTDMKFRNDTNIDSVLIGNGVLQITGCNSGSDGGSFYECISLKKILFSSCLNLIGEYAFSRCLSLTEVSIPSSVTSIGNNAFLECSSLTQISFENPSSLTRIGFNSFSDCSSLTQVVIPSSVTEIGDGAFSGCSSITRIEISPSVTSIGKSVFSNCFLLRKIVIPSSVTSIGDKAFEKCSSLTQISIPSSVTSIGDRAFDECSSLTQITIPSSVTSIGDFAFSECSSLVQITIPSSLTSISDYTLYGCSSLTQIIIPSSVASIGDNAFFECSSLTKVEIPSSVTSIGDHAFYGCSSLKQIKIPSSVTSIGNYTFFECSSLTQITIPFSVTSIGDWTFYKCTSLEQIKIPSSVTSIGNNTFTNCTSLTQIIIPASVTKIGKHAFDGCKLHITRNQTSSIYLTGVSPDQIKIIAAFISSKNEHELIRYIHNSCDNATIKKVYEKCRKTSPDFYLKLINEGISINDAVSHHEYALLCIEESTKIQSLDESNKKLNDAVYHLKESVKNGYLLSYLLLTYVYHVLFKNYVCAFNTASEGASRGEKHCKCMIGYFIAHGIGATKDFIKGVSIILSSEIPDFYEQFATDIGIYYSILVKEKTINCLSKKEKVCEVDDVIKIKIDDEICERTAFNWFELAFKKNKTKATINNLGVCYLKGYGVEKNIEKASEIFQNDSNTMNHFEFISEEEEDQNKYIQFYKRAEGQNDDLANVQINKERLLKYYTKDSKKFNDSSQFHDSERLIKEETDSDLSLYLKKKEAEKGNVEAQEFLLSKFIKENDTENIYIYYNMLINSGNFKAPLEFAVNLYNNQRFDQAFHYFSLLCSFNHPIARYYLGIMKFYGQGCAQDKNESFNILTELSKQGIEKATSFIEDHFNYA